MKLLFKNGYLIDPANNIEGCTDVLVNRDCVERVGTIDEKEADQTIDLAGKWIIPGAIDMHVHLRDPGQLDKEDIESGTLAALHGGFTSVCCMANTSPVNDNVSTMSYVMHKAKEKAHVHVYPIGAVTKQLEGKELTDFGDLKDHGAVALSDDGKYIHDSKVLRTALTYAKEYNLPLISHAEDPAFCCGGMNESFHSTVLGLPGIPAECESAAIAKDIEILHLAGGHLHIAHISTARGVEHVRRAKQDGLNVTAEAAPHHFVLTDQVLLQYSTNAKMNPPLRSEKDREAVLQAIIDGTIDAMATDHAPHTRDDKNVDFVSAPNGIIGLESALGLTLTFLYHTNLISKKRFVEFVSWNPAKILHLDKGHLGQGAPADITVIDPDMEWEFTLQHIKSKSKNTPFLNFSLKGKAVGVMISGKGYTAL